MREERREEERNTRLDTVIKVGTEEKERERG